MYRFHIPIFTTTYNLHKAYGMIVQMIYCTGLYSWTERRAVQCSLVQPFDFNFSLFVETMEINSNQCLLHIHSN